MLKLEAKWRLEFFAEEGPFRNEVPFSQPRAVFATHFTAVKWHSCAKGCFVGVFPTTKWGLGCEIEFLKGLVISHRISQLRNGGIGCEMALVCQGGVSQLWKFSQGGVMRLRNGFAAEGPFRNQPLISQQAPCGCEIILQQMAIFAKGYFGLRNFADHWIFLVLSSYWLPETFLHLFCNSS